MTASAERGLGGRRFFRAAALVAGLTLLMKSIALLKEVAIAREFGTGDDVEAFLAALLVPSCAISVVGASCGNALLPVFVRLRARGEALAAQRLFSAVLGRSLVLLGLVTAAMLATRDVWLPWIAGAFAPEKLTLTARLVPILAPVLMIRGAAALSGAVLNAEGRFALTALAPGCLPVGVLAGLLLGRPHAEALDLAFGMVLGAVMEGCFLFLAARRCGLSVRPRWSRGDPHVREVARQYRSLLTAALLLTGTGLVDQAMAADLGTGNVSAFAYATKLVAFPLGLGMTSLGMVAGPYCARLVARDDHRDMHREVKWLVMAVLVGATPLTALAMHLSGWATELVYVRGEFGSSDAAVVGPTVALLCVQMPFQLAGVLVARMLSAHLASRVLFVGSAISLGLNVLLNALLAPWFGIAGIALSTGCVYTLSFAFLWMSWHRVLSRGRLACG